MKMSENKLLQTSLHVRGRANQLFSVKFIEFSVRGGPSKILHPLQRGCHTRLTIRNKSKTNLMVRRAGLSSHLPFANVHIITITFTLKGFHLRLLKLPFFLCLLCLLCLFVWMGNLFVFLPSQVFLRTKTY